MKFEKTTQKCDIPFGLYRVDHEYLNSLHKADKNVISPEENDLYCRPVYHAKTERGVVGFFVSVDEKEYNSATVFAGIFMEGDLFGFIDFNKLIPIVDKRFLSTETNNKLLVEFCMKSQTETETCASAMMQARQENKPCPTLMF